MARIVKFQNNENTSTRLKQIMREKSLRQVDIVEKCQPYCKKYGVKLTKTDLSQYVSGKTLPKQDKLSILSMGLGVTETWLMGYDTLDQKETPFSINFTDGETDLIIELTNEIETNKDFKENVKKLLELGKAPDSQSFVFDVIDREYSRMIKGN